MSAENNFEPSAPRSQRKAETITEDQVFSKHHDFSTLESRETLGHDSRATELNPLVGQGLKDASAETVSKRKHEVLRAMQGIGNTENDQWQYDGVYAEEENYKTYDQTFSAVLEHVGPYQSIEELVSTKAAELQRPLTVLDLFGGAYFLGDLTDVSRIIGVRLKNEDEYNLQHPYRIARGADMSIVKRLVQDSRRSILEGNLYGSRAWHELTQIAREGHGFDLIACRPVGPFGHNLGVAGLHHSVVSVSDDALVREQIFVALLERAMNLLSVEGFLLTQMPELDTSEIVSATFWERFILEKEKQGYKIYFDATQPEYSESLAIVRKEKSLQGESAV
jgi:hypothetical protein